MHRRYAPVVVCCLALGGLTACGKAEQDPTGPDLAEPVVAHYGELGAAAHAEAEARVLELDEAIMAFLDDPTGGALNQTKLAYLNAREAYAALEAFRAPASPAETYQPTIDDHRVFERFLDYIQKDDDSGIINDPDDFPDLSLSVLREIHRLEDPRNVTLGFHPLAFLLWGEDLDPNGPGSRSSDDFVEGGPALNPDRRRTVLANVSQGLTDDITSLASGWAEESDYRTELGENESEEAVGDIVSGMRTATLALRDRLAVPFDAQGDEDMEELVDEYGDFSDRGLEDMAGQVESIRAVYTGEWNGMEGPGIDSLVVAADEELDTTVAEAIDAAASALAGIAVYDQAILVDAPDRDTVQTAIDALEDLADELELVAEALEVMLTEPPSDETEETGMFIMGETGEMDGGGTGMFLP